MCGSPSKTWLIGTLLFWLLLAVVRQVFDLIGRLWIPVAFNLFQILSCISGLFAPSQRRLTLLIVLTISCVISISYNVFVIFWYYDLLAGGYPRLLSAGLPYGQSFFIQHTPGCETFFNLSSSQWNQKPCSFPYYNAESVQAVVHILLAMMTFLFSLFVVCERLGQKEVVYHQTSNKIVAKPLNDHAVDNEAGSSYMNSSYGSPNLLLNSKYSEIRKKSDQYVEVKEKTKSEQYKRIQNPTTSEDYSKLSSRNKRRSEYLSPENLSYHNDYAGSVKSSRPVSQCAVAVRLANHQSNEVTLKRKPVSTGNLTSLISFDPKTNDEDIVKVREHQNDSEEEEDVQQLSFETKRSGQRRDSQDSTPSMKAPVLSYVPTRSEIPLDSGHPSTSTNETDWSTEFTTSPPLLQKTLNLTKRLEEDNFRSRLIPCTSFPIQQHQSQRKMMGMSMSTQMTLLDSCPTYRIYNEMPRRLPSDDQLPPPPPPLSSALRAALPRPLPRPPDPNGLLV